MMTPDMRNQKMIQWMVIDFIMTFIILFITGIQWLTINIFLHLTVCMHQSWAMEQNFDSNST